MDRDTPVIVGVGQVNGAAGAEEPLDLVALAVERAIADSGGARIPVDLVALSKIGTRTYWNAPASLAERTGFAKARTLQASHGGHTVQVVLAHAATEIAQGRARAAIVAGGELGSALRKGSRAAGSGGERGTPKFGTPDVALGDDLSQWLNHPHELAFGIAMPIQVYPVMETALGAALGRSRDEHLSAISELWARFSEVAVDNEFAADRKLHSATEIATAGPSNRYVGYPYTKLMNSDQFVDQAAAILLCSAGVATDLGISRDQWVFPLASVTGHAPFVSERWTLHDIPVLATASGVVARMVGRPMRDAELVDLYACFPFAVQAQARALDLAPTAELTLTGGMRFAGGPWNNYGAHQMVNLVLRLREQPESLGVCSTNGGLATRFCVTAYSGQPSPSGFQSLPAPLVDATPRRRLETRPEGVGQIEGYTVNHDRANEPVDGIAACILPDQSRAWARLPDPQDVAELLASDPIGRAVRFAAEGARLD